MEFCEICGKEVNMEKVSDGRFCTGCESFHGLGNEPMDMGVSIPPGDYHAVCIGGCATEFDFYLTDGSHYPTCGVCGGDTIYRPTRDESTVGTFAYTDGCDHAD